MPEDMSNIGKLWSASENLAVFSMSTVQWKKAIFPTLDATAERPLLMIYFNANFYKTLLKIVPIIQRKR